MLLSCACACLAPAAFGTSRLAPDNLPAMAAVTPNDDDADVGAALAVDSGVGITHAASTEASAVVQVLAPPDVATLALSFSEMVRD